MNKITKLKFVDPNEELLTEDDAYALRTFLDRTLKVSAEFEWNLKTGNQTGTCKGESKFCVCSNIHEIDGRACIEVCKHEADCDKFKKDECPGIFCFRFESNCVNCTDWKHDCKKCAFAWDPSKDPSGVRKLLTAEFFPTNNACVFGQKGVHAVKTDGSLDHGGVEITMVGRRPDYYAFLNQYREVFNRVNELGGYVNERAGLHYHMLVSYAGNSGSNTNFNYSSMEKPLPGLFLRNFHQLFRVFHNPLIWISSSGKSWDKLTRWSKFRESIISISGVKHSAEEIQELLRPSNKRYSMVHYQHCKIFENKISTFHIEARHCDAVKAPTAAASMAMLLYAFAMKAADMSVHGVLSMPDKFYKKQVSIAPKLMNLNDSNGEYGEARYSDTSGIEDHASELKAFSVQMVDFVKTYLKRWPEAVDVLYSLAEKPCSLRQIEGDNWSKIEDDLYAMGKRRRQLKPQDLEILKVIDLCLVSGIDPDEWTKDASKETGKSAEDITKSVKVLSDEGLITWSDKDQAFMRV